MAGVGGGLEGSTHREGRSPAQKLAYPRRERAGAALLPGRGCERGRRQRREGAGGARSLRRAAAEETKFGRLALSSRTSSSATAASTAPPRACQYARSSSQLASSSQILPVRGRSAGPPRR